MNNRRWFLSCVVICLLITAAMGCGKERDTQVPPTHVPTFTPLLAITPIPPTLTTIPAAATVSPTFTVPSEAVAISGPSLTDVQFALDVEQSGELVFPATEFIYGITRVYVRFSYRGLEDVSAVQSIWYRNENLVSTGELAWDGGEVGAYIIWLEDPQGLGRGLWRWELTANGLLLGSGAFTIGGEPGYVNDAWGLSFDPPPAWQLQSESADSVTFSSPNQRQALALRFAAEPDDGSLVTVADLSLFQVEHPEAEVVASEEVTMNGEKALLQQVRYADQEDGEEFLFIVSALHAESAYSLWLLGPVDEVASLKTRLVATLHSVRFLAAE